MPLGATGDKTKHTFINNRASSEAATGPGILVQNTERRKGAYALGGHGGLKIAAGSFTGTDRWPIFM